MLESLLIGWGAMAAFNMLAVWYIWRRIEESEDGPSSLDDQFKMAGIGKDDAFKWIMVVECVVMAPITFTILAMAFLGLFDRR